MSRHDSLQYKAKRHQERVPFVITHHPGNPPLRQWLQSLHSEMKCTSRRMSDAVPAPPIVGERRPTTMRKHPSLSPTRPKFYKKNYWEPPKGRDDSLDTFCSTVVSRVTAHAPRLPKQRNISRKSQEALQQLRDLVQKIILRISPADKGGAVVVQSFNQYHEEAMRQLGNTEHYRTSQEDPSQDIAKQFDRMEEINPESLQPCPYNPFHMIRTKRMQMHIYDCRKNHPSSELTRCPFNASHAILVPEMRWHLLTCPDRHQVHSKIVEGFTADSGCTATPAYMPIIMDGESWEAPRVGAGSKWHSHPSPPPPMHRPAFQLTDEEVKGLTPRERQQLYLRKKAEREAAEKKSQSLTNREPLRAHNTASGQSQSLALFQQQTERKVLCDIYKDALKGPQNGIRGIGRGSATRANKAPGPNHPGFMMGRSQGRGEVVYNNNSPSLPPPVFTPIGRGGGLLATPSSTSNSGDAPRLGGQVPMTNMGGLTNQGEDRPVALPGRGSALAMLRAQQAAVAGRGGPAASQMPSSRGPPGVWQGGAAPMTVGGIGRGGGYGSAVDPLPSGMGIPFSGMTSQPDALTPSFGHMTLSGPSIGGRGTSTMYASGEVEMKASPIQSDDLEQFVYAAVPWVGGGYGQGGAGEGDEGGMPMLSSSGMSLLSNPQTVGSWAMEMEKGESYDMATSYVSPVTDSDDIGNGLVRESLDSMTKQQIEKQLKKLQKKLKQIADIEAKKAGGMALEDDQEAKLKTKAECERQLAEFQKRLECFLKSATPVLDFVFAFTWFQKALGTSGKSNASSDSSNNPSAVSQSGKEAAKSKRGVASDSGSERQTPSPQPTPSPSQPSKGPLSFFKFHKLTLDFKKNSSSAVEEKVTATVSSVTSSEQVDDQAGATPSDQSTSVTVPSVQVSDDSGDTGGESDRPIKSSPSPSDSGTDSSSLRDQQHTLSVSSYVEVSSDSDLKTSPLSDAKISGLFLSLGEDVEEGEEAEGLGVGGEEDVPLATPPDSSMIFQDISIPSTMICQEFRSNSQFTVYQIEYESLHFSETGIPVMKTGTAKRRYREFVNLMSRLEDNTAYKRLLKDVKGPKRWLTLPFKNMDKESVASRQKALEQFLKSLVEVEAVCNGPEMREFLAYEGDSHIAFVKKPTEINVPRIDKMLARTVSGVFDKLKSLPNLPQEVISGIRGRDPLVDRKDSTETDADNICVHTDYSHDYAHDLSFYNMLRDVSESYVRDVQTLGLPELIPSSPTSQLLKDMGSSLYDQILLHVPRVEGDGAEYPDSAVEGGGQAGVGSGQLLLCDAVLDFVVQLLSGQPHHHWLCHQRVLTCLRNVLGSTLDRWVKETVSSLTTEERCLYYIRLLRETVWPGGKLFSSQTDEKTEEEKIATRTVAKRLLVDFFPGSLTMLLGAGSLDAGVEVMLESMQYSQLNKHFLYTTIDMLLESLLPEIADPQFQGRLLSRP
ncbi:hypothetical protein ACOMHN_052120 [Nucella lapillus]